MNNFKPDFDPEDLIIKSCSLSILFSSQYLEMIEINLSPNFFALPSPIPVTIGDKTFKLQLPFLVMATQNPIEQEGTYPLPEAQMDRFMLKCVITYPEFEDEQQIVRSNINESFEKVKPVISVKDILNAQQSVKDVYMDEKIEKYILSLIFATRYPEKNNLSELKPLIGFGSSPRGSINLASAAKCYAFIQRRGYVIPEDIRAVIHDVLRHRIGLTYEAEAENVTSEDVISKIVNSVEVP